MDEISLYAGYEPSIFLKNLHLPLRKISQLRNLIIILLVSTTILPFSIGNSLRIKLKDYFGNSTDPFI
jgi:ABC-type transport system involved in cytochrome c biogenesis permease component